MGEPEGIAQRASSPPPDPHPSSAAPGNDPFSSSMSPAHEPPEPIDRSHQQQQRPLSRPSHRANASLSTAAPSRTREEVLSSLFVIVFFWFFVSTTIIIAFYGSLSLQLGNNCSRLIQVNPFFVQYVKLQQIDDSKPGPTLYGFYKPPPLDVQVTWTDTRDSFISADFHKEWIYYLNKGSKVEISYSVKSPSSSALCLVIARGRESLVEWIEDPSYPNSTISWNIIFGTGKIEQEIPESSSYYIAVGNFNSVDIEIQLKLVIRAFVFNTSEAYYKCSLSDRLCSFKLSLLQTNVAVLTSPAPKERTSADNWYVKLSYGARWITYLVGAGAITALIFVVSKCCNMFQPLSRNEREFQVEQMGPERAPLLSNRDNDSLSSGGSSCDSASHDEKEMEEWLAENASGHVLSKEGDNNKNPNRLCAVCFDAPRDCFFLPCGHFVTCFVCGTRIAEEARNCPICRKKMKKVRKIFTV